MYLSVCVCELVTASNGWWSRDKRRKHKIEEQPTTDLALDIIETKEREKKEER